ncbi:MAG TPA: glycosyltransferase family 4 protein [Bryobacteraceae bacterium]|nr:glycosyltransferase family 4 protein [Bryobacteraceae bacterium]
MRVLLTSNASYAPARGGSTRSNLAWLRYLAEHKHPCRVVCASLEGDCDDTVDGIHIHSVKNLVQRRAVLDSHIHQFQPDFVLVSSEDLSHLLLAEAARVAPDRLVYLAHTPQFFPFGPESWNSSQRATAILRSARAIVAIGESAASYIQKHAGIAAKVIHPPIYGREPYARLGCFDRGSVMMINPCQVKGIGIFLELARRFPDVTFQALAGWGTTGEDRRAMAQLPNVQVIESVGNIEEALAQARVLLMPSLWYEGFGLIGMEAMLRGIPVVSSDSGGLVEARQGSGFVIPVRRIERYLPEFDDTHMPRPVIPEQNLQPWAEALGSLLGDRTLYESESEKCRAAALGFVEKLDASEFEKFLASLGSN